MKKTFIIGILLLSIFSCEKNKENKDNGDFIAKDSEKASDMTVEEEMKLMEDHIVEVSKKYGITADEVKKKLEEVGKYLDEDVVPDKEYKNQ